MFGSFRFIIGTAWFIWTDKIHMHYATTSYIHTHFIGKYIVNMILFPHCHKNVGGGGGGGRQTFI